MAKRTWPPPAVFGFLLPNFLGFIAFTLLPIVLSLWMAFTNWSLKPAVSYEVLGLRNFQDLVGVRALGDESAAVWVAYFAAAAALVAGLVGVLWANVSGWRGAKVGGAMLAAAGLAAAALAVGAGADHGIILAGGVAAACGTAAMLREEGRWRPGLGTLGGLLVLAGAVGLWLLHGRMWDAYEPRDARFWRFFYNTAYLMLSIPFSIGGSLALALLVNADLPLGRARSRAVAAGVCLVCGAVTLVTIWGLGHRDAALLAGVFWVMAAAGLAFNMVAFRTLFYLPTFCAGVALYVLWKALYNPQTGPINASLESLFAAVGLAAEAPEWLGSVTWAKPAIMIMGVWTAIGGTNMLLYLAGLSNISQDLIDAAEVDGAGFWGKFRHVTWPQLAPTTFFISIMAVIGGLQGGFEEARVMTNGGPAGATTTLSFYIYNIAFQDLDLGYAAAISWVLFAMIFAATLLNWRFGKSLEVSL
jgi:multiple sugar transport system permease protein